MLFSLLVGLAASVDRTVAEALADGLPKGDSPFVAQPQSRRTGEPQLLLALLFLSVVNEGFAEGAGVSQSRGPATLTIESILEREVPSVKNVKWYDSNVLMGEFTESESGKPVTRTISQVGVLGEPLNEGRFSSLSPDGRLLLQRAKVGWVIHDLEHGEAISLDNGETENRNFSPCCAPVWSRDGHYAAFIESYRPTAVSSEIEPKTIAGVSIIDMEHSPSRLMRWGSRISILDRADLADVQRILLDNSALSMQWDGKNALFVSRSNLVSGQPSTEIVRILPGSQEVELIYHTPGRFQSIVPAVRPSGDVMALVLDADNRTWDDFTSILLIDSNTGEEIRRLTYDLPIKGKDYVWSTNGDEIYARVGFGGLDQIYAVPIHGNPRRLTRGTRRHFNMSLSPNGRQLSYQTEDGYGRRDIRILDLKSDEERIVLLLDNPAKHFQLGEWQHVRWQSTDGVQPFGYLITPPDFDRNRRYPMIVDVHGGGEGSRLYLAAPLTLGVTPGPLEWHAWAALGYVVFVPDYRSTGDYGPEVIAARYKSGQLAAIKDIEDIVSGTRFVTDQGFVDPSRIAILGHSAGGQRVYILLTQHDFYAAAILNEAIPPDPVSIFIKLASGANTGGYPAGVFSQMYGGSLAALSDRYKVNYMFDSHRIKTPTLIMLGNEGLGGSSHMPNEVFYSILKQHGIPTKLLKFVEEGHTYSSAAAVRLAFGEVRRWLEANMPGQLVSSERAH